jgi:hypothetical protein
MVAILLRYSNVVCLVHVYKFVQPLRPRFWVAFLVGRPDLPLACFGLMSACRANVSYSPSYPGVGLSHSVVNSVRLVHSVGLSPWLRRACLLLIRYPLCSLG